MNRFIAFLFVLVVVATGCGNKRTTLTAGITEAEAGLFSDQSVMPDNAKARNMIDLYLKYQKTFPEDTIAAQYLFRAAQLAQSIKEFNTAIGLYDSLINIYPQYYRAPDALFLKAFVYDNSLQRYESAREVYTLFLSKYPNHHLADDATQSIEFLGKTNEEILEILLSRQNQQE